MLEVDDGGTQDETTTVNLTTRCGNFEKKSFSLNRFKNDKSMGFYTEFTNGEIFDALYYFFDSGEDGENVRYWHSSSTDQDTTVLSENDEYLESFPKPYRPRLPHPKEELFITLCRLRQGFPEEHLAHLYGVWKVCGKCECVSDYNKKDNNNLGEPFIFKTQGCAH